MQNCYPRRGPLTDKQLRIIELVHAGCNNDQIATKLGLSVNVMKNYLVLIFDRVGVWNRVELALWYEVKYMERKTLPWARLLR